MGKSKNLRMGGGESLTSVVFDKQKCAVCGREAHPWGIYNHGKDIVCSRYCGAKYVEKRNELRNL